MEGKKNRTDRENEYTNRNIINKKLSLADYKLRIKDEIQTAANTEK